MTDAQKIKAAEEYFIQNEDGGYFTDSKLMKFFIEELKLTQEQADERLDNKEAASEEEQSAFYLWYFNNYMNENI